MVDLVKSYERSKSKKNLGTPCNSTKTTKIPTISRSNPETLFIAEYPKVKSQLNDHFQTPLSHICVRKANFNNIDSLLL